MQSMTMCDQSETGGDQYLWDAANKMIRGRIAPHNVLLSHMVVRSPFKDEIRTVLEIGSGSGQFSYFMHEYKHKVTLIDASTKAIELGKASFKGNEDDVDFIVGDILNCQLKETFDLVYSGGLLEHYSGEELRQMFLAHIRASDRFVLIAVPSDVPRNWSRAIRNNDKSSTEGALPNWKPISEAQLIDLFEENGLEPVMLSRVDETYGERGLRAKFRREMIRRRIRLSRSIGTGSGGLLVGLGRIRNRVV